MERIDQLSAAPVVGKFYLVPAILWSWRLVGHPSHWWPVMGPKHDDTEFFNFPAKHYHVDPRFLTARLLVDLGESKFGSKQQTVLGSPLNSRDMPDGPEPPTWRKMKCTASAILYPFGETEQVKAINQHWAGQQCDRSKYGWICPHRNVQLGSIAAIDGVITCPLHGMRIDAASGCVLE